MMIEFSVDVPNVSTARSIAELVSAHGYEPRIFVCDEDGSVSVYCAKMMMATYDGVVAGQAEVNCLCEPFGGECDGWGTFGNLGNQ
jgi:regulator of RNase E activity RraB